METKFTTKKGFRLTVNPNTGRVTLKLPEDIDRNSNLVSRIKKFAKEVSDLIRDTQDRTFRGQIVVCPTRLYTNMYNDNRQIRLNFESGL